MSSAGIGSAVAAAADCPSAPAAIAEPPALINPPGAVTLTTKIDSLKKRQANMLKEKQQLAKEIKNAERKRRRLKDKAKMLTDSDLIAVLRLRQEKAAATAAASSSSSTATHPDIAVPAEAEPIACPTNPAEAQVVCPAEAELIGSLEVENEGF